MIRPVFLHVKYAKRKIYIRGRIMMNENGQRTLVGKKLEYARIQTSIVTTNMMWWSSFSLSLLPLYIVEREKKKKENKLVRASRNLYKIWSKKGHKIERKKYKPQHSFPTFVFCLQLLRDKQTSNSWIDDNCLITI